MAAIDCTLDRQVLILAPAGADATVVKEVLTRAKIEARICPDAESLANEVRSGVGALLVTEEAMGRVEIAIIGELLASQPEWSDLPVILLAAANHDAGPLIERLCRSATRHVSVLERPIRSSTLQAAAQAAIRSRERQYQVRDELDRRRAAERALRASEERLRLAAQAARFGTYDADLVDGAIEATEETRRLLGFTEDTSIALDPRALLDQIHPDDLQGLLDATSASFDPQGDGVLDEEHRVVLADGTVRWIMVRGRTTFQGDAAERRAVRSTGTMIDITTRKRAEEQLIDADRRKDLFLATLAHELRNPLAALRISLDVVSMTAQAGSRVAASCQIMERQIEALVRLVDDLVDVTRVIRGKLELQRTRVDLREVVQRAVEEAGSLIEQAGHELSVDVGDAPLLLEADPIRLAQVFANLLSNAAKYTPPGGRVELTAEPRDDGICVSVGDDGFGIPVDELESIFEMFSQAHGPMERGHKGLGIGLSLARSLVELHGGTIEAHSEGLGRGSRFDVRLPVAVDATSPETAGVETGNGAGPPGEVVRRVLVVDDNRDAAQSLADWVQLLGHETRCAFDGVEAFEIASRFRPHLVLLDIGLPKMSGYDVARRIRSQGWGEGMVLAAVSGWGRDSDRQQAVEAGFDRHLTKPPQPESLRALLAMVSPPD